MTTLTLREAQINLEKLVHELRPGEEIVIMEHNRSVAKLIIASDDSVASVPRKLGFLAGSVTEIADDFDAPLADMLEHMQ